jgi:hypothetical protein
MIHVDSCAYNSSKFTPPCRVLWQFVTGWLEWWWKDR